MIAKKAHYVRGTRQQYYQLEIATEHLKILVPVAEQDELIREVISKTRAAKVIRLLRQEPSGAGSNWSRWFKVLNEKMTSGVIDQVAEVVRDLSYTQQTKGISPALKRMLSKARNTLTSELQFSLGISMEEVLERIEKALPKFKEPQG